MPPRPVPPILPDNPEDFAQHVSKHLTLWYNFCKDSYEFANTQETDLSQLQQEQTQTAYELRQVTLQVEQLRQERDLAKGIQAYQSEELLQVREQLARAIASEARALANKTNARENKARAIKAALLTVYTPISSPTTINSAKTLLDPYNRKTSLTSPAPRSSVSKSEKIPNPKKFKGSRTEFNIFASKIREKIIIN